MSIETYLKDISSKLIVDSNENYRIMKSVNYFKNKMESYFGNNIKEIKIFGSYDRDTNLPRNIDSKSDVDIMFVFKDDGSKPQTFLDRIRRVVENYYTSSDIKQSSPTIVLDMDHIKFEITPAIEKNGVYYIKRNDEWCVTNCLNDKSNLVEANRNNLYKIKPVIRLIKYWNVCKNNKNISSYLIETEIVKNFKCYTQGCYNLIEYLIVSFRYLRMYVEQKTYQDKIDSAIEYLESAKKCENDDYLYSIMTLNKVIEDL